jgi:hypothetical protein
MRKKGCDHDGVDAETVNGKIQAVGTHYERLSKGPPNFSVLNIHLTPWANAVPRV